MIYTTPEEMAKLDLLSQRDYGIPSIILMENAGRATAEVVYSCLVKKRDKRVVCVCGKGNNGGDGFVCARHLANCGIQTDIFLIGNPASLKGDAKINYNILSLMGEAIHLIRDEGDCFVLEGVLKKSAIVIDAIFGIGLRGRVREPYASIIDCINRSGKTIVSIDVPSGLDALNGRALGACIKADKTVTFALAKTGFVKNEGRRYTGRVLVKDISIPAKLLRHFFKHG